MISIRGAIIVNENSKEIILMQSRELLSKIIQENQIIIEDIVSIIFSATKDLTKAYPAPAARELGITKASLLCVQEMYVEDSMEKCLRILMHVKKQNKNLPIQHIYLNGAELLRPDLNSIE